MPSFEFIGGSSKASTLSADAQVLFNLFLETDKSPTGTTQGGARALLGTPGLANSCLLPTSPVQAEFEAAGRGFVVSGWTLYEVFAAGTYNTIGAISAGTTIAMRASPSQLCVSNGTNGYIYQLANGVNFDTNAAETAGTFSQITDVGWLGGPSLEYLDGYFIGFEPVTQVFTFSALNDGLSWAALDFGAATSQPENIVGLLVSHRELWIMCADHGELYYDSGNALSPLARLEGAFIPQGLASSKALNLCDNTVFWLGQNKDGAGICWRAEGYTPLRFSDYKLEAALATYALLPGGLSGASSYPYQEGGHTFWRLDVQGNTWVYDVGENEWHQRGQYNGLTDTFSQHPAQCHMYVFGQHLVGGAASGQLYTQSMTNLTDTGASIRRVRRAPVVYDQDEFLRFPSLVLGMQTGLVAQGAAPTITLRTSNDGGSTFGSDRTIPCGFTGNYALKVEWRRGGRSRRRVYEVMIEVPNFVAYTSAVLEMKK